MIFSTRAVDFLIARLGVEKKFGERGGAVKVDLFFFFRFYIGERGKRSLIMETIVFGERGIRIYGKIRATLE